MTNYFVEMKTRTVTAEIKMATMIEFSEILLDTSSEEYRTASQNIKDVFQTDLDDMAGTIGLTLESLSVLFQKSVGGNDKHRQRRSTGTDAIITAVYTVPESKSTNLAKFEDEILSATTTAANTAILNSAGTFISTDAVASVLISTEEATLQTTTSTTVAPVTTATVTTATTTTATTTTATTTAATTTTTLTPNGYSR